MDTNPEAVIERLRERKRKLAEEIAEVDFLLEAAVKHTKKRKFDPQQLAAARANRKKLEAEA